MNTQFLFILEIKKNIYVDVPLKWRHDGSACIRSGFKGAYCKCINLFYHVIIKILF